jgi:acetyl-CoA carboxylase biotin carboxyl carrier protein
MSNKDIPVDKIKSLSKILKDEDLTEIELELEGMKIKVRKEAVHVSAPVMAAAAPAASNTAAIAAPAVASLKEIKSPMVGTFYASPSPDAGAFVKVGDKIKKGDVVCIVEAMKIMNELPSDIDGEIVEILCTNSQSVSYGQALFKVK